MMSLSEMNERMSRLRNWAFEGNSIVKDKVFRDFKEAIEFLNKVGEIAEKRNHHPSIVLDYNVVKLTLTTHSERSLTEKDFEVAEEIDKIHK